MAIRRPGRERVLVAVVAETRAWQLTAQSFFDRVLDPLRADLALCIGDRDAENPFLERARFVWRAEEPADWAELYDRKVGSSRWRTLLKPEGQLLGGADPNVKESGSGAIVLYFRQFLKESIEQAAIADEYDWLIVTRSDLLWPIEHPRLRDLSPRHIYALDGEGYGGVEDRHLIVPRRYMRRFLEVPDPIFSDPEGLKGELDRARLRYEWDVLNPERFLAARLGALGLLRRVRYLPYAPYLVRGEGDTTRWMQGVFDEQLGGYVKYPTELARSRIARSLLSGQDPWGRFLAPVRGAPLRRRLRREYEARGLYERPFSLRAGAGRAARRVRRSGREQRERLARGVVWLGRPVRRVPAMASLLDARIRWMRRRAGRRSSTG